MANRPVFVPLAVAPWVRREDVEFTWHPGLSVAQKRKSIESLHQSAIEGLSISSPLEISSKSRQVEGVALSAFNLRIRLPDGHTTTVECAYQGSKRFDVGGPFRDLYHANSLDAKRDARIRNSKQRLVDFSYFAEDWPLVPDSLFYDWLYLSALTQVQNVSLLEYIVRHDAFTDIEFNPAKAISCQASSAAKIVGLSKGNIKLLEIVQPLVFKTLFAQNTSHSSAQQLDIF